MLSDRSSPDRRRWSATANGVSLILQQLMSEWGNGVFLANSHQLRDRFVEHGVYPARDWAHLCLDRPPDVFVTYDWTAPVGDVQNAIWGAMDHAGGVMSDLGLVEDPEPLVGGQVGVWVDWIFIDQNARDLPAELSVLPDILSGCDVHVVLSESALARAWCCWEIAQFNARFETDVPVPRSLLAPQPRYEGWDRLGSFDAEDKRGLHDDLVRNFPGGMANFEMMMLIAGEVSNMSTASANPNVWFGEDIVMAQTGPAIENLRSAVARWARRATDS